MSKKLPHTPTSRIKDALRKLWLRSRERAAAIKRDGYSCQTCGAKQSRAKGREVFVEVNHRHGIRWVEIIKFIREELLCGPEHLETLCKECHAEVTKDQDTDNDHHDRSA